MSENRPSVRTHAMRIYSAVIGAVGSYNLVRRAMSRQGETLTLGGQTYALARSRRVVVVGAGKAACGMAQAAADVLGPSLGDAIVVTKYGHGRPLTGTRVLEAGHPVPDAASVAAGEALHGLCASAEAGDLVIGLLSGGASALMELPAPGVTLEQIREVTSALLRAGAPIQALNAVRSRLSRIKGGGLAAAAASAETVCLVLSDVLGNDLRVIASGPFYPLPAASEAPWEVIRRYQAEHAVPASLVPLLRHPVPPREPAGLPPRHVLVGDLETALAAARQAAERAGFAVEVVSSRLEGEARMAGNAIGQAARALVGRSQPTCLLWGGETTVTVRGAGLGGRSQELAAAAAQEIAGVAGLAVLAAGTDGTDGPTDAAGGLVTGDSYARISKRDFDRGMAENDSYHLLQGMDGLLRTGPTDSNVGDIAVALYCP